MQELSQTPGITEFITGKLQPWTWPQEPNECMAALQYQGSHQLDPSTSEPAIPGLCWHKGTQHRKYITYKQWSCQPTSSREHLHSVRSHPSTDQHRLPTHSASIRHRGTSNHMQSGDKTTVNTIKTDTQPGHHRNIIRFDSQAERNSHPSTWEWKHYRCHTKPTSEAISQDSGYSGWMERTSKHICWSR